MQKVIALAVLGLTIGVATGVCAELSICEVQRPSTSASEIVSIRGRLGFTSHGIFLLATDCGGKAEDAVVLFPGVTGTPPVPFALDDGTRVALRSYVRPTGGTATACALVRGQVFHKKNLKTRREGAGLQGNGFGPRGAFDIAVVVKSIEEIRACN